MDSQAIGQEKGLDFHIVNSSSRGRGMCTDGRVYSWKEGKRLFQKQSKMLSEKDINSCDLGCKPASHQCVQEADFSASRLFCYHLPAKLHEPFYVSLGCFFFILTYGAGRMLSLFPIRLPISQILLNFSRKIQVLDKKKMEVYHQREKKRKVLGKLLFQIWYVRLYWRLLG